MKPKEKSTNDIAISIEPADAISDLKKAYEGRLKLIKAILFEHKKGKSTRQIAIKVKAAESYVVEVCKKGENQSISDLKKLYGVNDDDVNSSMMTPSTHEYLCVCGTVMFDGKPETANNGYIFRTLICTKCNKKYYNPLDISRYLSNIDMNVKKEET